MLATVDSTIYDDEEKGGVNHEKPPHIICLCLCSFFAGAKDLTRVEFLYLFLGANYDYFRRHFFSTSFSGMVAF